MTYLNTFIVKDGSVSDRQNFASYCQTVYSNLDHLVSQENGSTVGGHLLSCTHRKTFFGFQNLFLKIINCTSI